MQSVLFWAAVTAYALSTAALVASLAFRRERLAGVGRWLAAAGLLPHAAAIGLRWAEVGHGPYVTRYEVLSADVLLLVTVYVAGSLLARGLRPLGAFVMPLAFLGMGWAVSTFDLRAEVPIIFRSYWLWLHIGFAKAFGACTLVAAGAAAAHLLKARRPERLGWLPAAEELDLYAHQFLLVAFLFLGVMIAAGSLWAHQSWGRYWGWDPIETSALVTWIAFGVVLHFRVLHRWSGRRMAVLTFVAAGFMIVTVFVVAAAVPTIHDSYMVGK
ncbi:MAG TPA: cytochrome c biogenesis protein CcsA [Anaeromyxobacteraceae bacterium]|nr:cytochrome c biogenesis protein CcsA [Anaeromyxobacteraceae bacterium]